MQLRDLYRLPKARDVFNGIASLYRDASGCRKACNVNKTSTFFYENREGEREREGDEVLRFDRSKAFPRKKILFSFVFSLSVFLSAKSYLLLAEWMTIRLNFN